MLASTSLKSVNVSGRWSVLRREGARNGFCSRPTFQIHIDRRAACAAMPMRCSLCASAEAVRRRRRRSSNKAAISPDCTSITAPAMSTKSPYASQKLGSLKDTTASAGTASASMPKRRAWRQSTCTWLGMVFGSTIALGAVPASNASTVSAARRPIAP
jgi:hypothetical protein